MTKDVKEHSDQTKRIKAYIKDWQCHVEASLRRFRFFKSFDARYAAEQVRIDKTQTSLPTNYARRLCISVMAGMFFLLEKGFHWFTSSQNPDTLSPKFLGELSYTCKKNWFVTRCAQTRDLLRRHLRQKQLSRPSKTLR